MSVALPSRSSLKRFINCSSKALNVVWGSEKPRVGFPPALSEVFSYLDADFFDILFRVPQCDVFLRCTFFAYFKSLIKISKGFKK